MDNVSIDCRLRRFYIILEMFFKIIMYVILVVDYNFFLLLDVFIVCEKKII